MENINNSYSLFSKLNRKEKVIIENEKNRLTAIQSNEKSISQGESFERNQNRFLKRIISFILAVAIFNSANIYSIGKILILFPVATLAIEKNVYADSGSEEGKSKVDRSHKSKTIAIILALFLGFHHFYLKNNITGVLYILITLIYGLGYILSLIDFLVMLNMSSQEWQQYLESDRALLWIE